MTVGDEDRLFMLMYNSAASGQNPNHVDVAYNKFTKATGPGIVNAQTEACESWGGNSVWFRWCWVTESSEDAYEHVNVIDDCTVEYCVADNTARNAVDYYKQWNADTRTLYEDTSGAPNSNCYVHHVYGDSGEHSLGFWGLVGAVFHDFYVNNTSEGETPLIYLTSRDGSILRDVYGAGPFTLGLTNYVEIDTPGVDIEVNYFNNFGGTGTMTTVSAESA